MHMQVQAVPDRAVKGVNCLLTVADIAQILARPKRWVRARLINGRLLETVGGGNSVRVKPLVLQTFIDRGMPGLRRQSPSGAYRRERVQA